MNREEAYELLHRYMKGENYIQHSMAVEAIMRGAWPSALRLRT